MINKIKNILTLVLYFNSIKLKKISYDFYECIIGKGFISELSELIENNIINITIEKKVLKEYHDERIKLFFKILNNKIKEIENE